MKKIKLLWAVLCFVLLMNRSQAQSSDSPYQLQVVKGQSLLEAINRLADEYEIDFAYAPHVLDQAQLSAAQLSASNIESLLRQLLAGVPVQYRIVSDNRILLRGISLQDDAYQNSSLSLNGQIIDAATGAPMMNVAIALDTLNLGALSDEKGIFSFKIPSALKDRMAWIHHLGYTTRQIPIGDFKKGQPIYLQASSISLNEVLITEQLPGVVSSLNDGSIVISEEGLERGAASQLGGPSIFRDVQLMPGINADDDLSNDIRIRGSNADETLIVLDGMPLYKVDHFFGVFSALNSSYVEEVRLFKNVMPIQYGGRTGGLLLLQSAKEITKFEGAVDVNLLSTALQLNVPFTEKLGLSLSGRRSHANVANSKFFDWVGPETENYIEVQSSDARPDLINTTPDFGFSDWNGKLLFTPNEKHRFALNFYQSNDDFLNSYEYRIVGRLNGDRRWHQEIFEDRQDWQNIGTSLQYEAKLTNNWQLEADAFYTRYTFSDALKIDINRLVPRRNTPSQLDTVNIRLRNNRFNLVENGGYRMLLSKDFGNSRLLETGSSWNYHRTDFAVSSEVETLLSNKASSYDAQIFANYQWSPLDRLQLSVGGRLNYYQQTEGIYFSPRVRVNYLLDNELRLKAAYNVNYQFIREITYENRLGQSIDLIVLSDVGDFPVGRSTNYMLGANYQYKHWFFDVEFYYKKRANVIEYASTNLGFGTQFVGPGQRQRYGFFQGTGNVFGLDAMISWDYSRYSGHIAYTLSKATNEFSTILNGDPVPARDDRRHQLKWVNIWKQGKFDFSANYIYSSGRPYYDVRRITENEENRQRRFINWLPSYQRLDVGVAYRFTIGSSKAKIGASIFNVTNHDNVKYLQFIYSATAERNNTTVNTILGSQTDLLDRTLNLSFGLEF